MGFFSSLLNLFKAITEFYHPSKRPTHKRSQTNEAERQNPSSWIWKSSCEYGASPLICFAFDKMGTHHWG